MNNIPQAPIKTKTFLKQKRNRQYEDISKEFTEAGLNLSEIKIQDFAESRKKEISKFIQILSSKKTSKNGHQLLPRHMRRRQMSHNPFRIPSRNRLANLNVKIRSKCRKHKRKLKNLQKSLIRRATKQEWLETHLWHSKRFYMQKMLDKYTIAYKRRDKSFRACYRFWEHSSVIHDQSYHEYIIISFEECSDISTFNNLLIETYTINTDKIDYKEMKVYENDLYHLGNMIGPIEWFYLGNVIIWMIHPLIREEIMALLKEINEGKGFKGGVEMKFSHQFNIFKIMGPKAEEQLFKVFKACEENDDSNGELLSSYNNFEKRLNKMNSGTISILKLNKPSSHFKINELIMRSLTEKLMNFIEENNTNGNNNDKMIIEESSPSYYDKIQELFMIKSMTFDQIINKRDNENHEENTSMENGKDDFLLSKFTERTTYMHRKKVDLKVLNKKLEQSILTNRNKQNQIITLQPKKESGYISNKKYDTDIIKAKEVLSIKVDTYILLIKKTLYYYPNNDNSKYLSSQPIYIIVFPRGYSTDLLRRFSYLNTKVIGLKEYQRFLIQHNQMIFPNDYPCTMAYSRIIEEKTKKKLSSYYKKPPGKRINYQKIGNPYPFYPSWQSLSSLNKETIIQRNMTESLTKIIMITCLNNKEKLMKLKTLTKQNNSMNNQLPILHVNIITISKGVPKYNDLLCLPTESDIELYLKFQSDTKAINNALFSDDNTIKKCLPLNIINTTQTAFHLEEKYQRCIIKNNNFNLELLSVLAYHNATNGNLQLTNEILNPNLTIKTKQEPIHQIIGFITSSIYDYESSHSKGKGCILLSHFSSLIALKNKYHLTFIPCLLRNKTSKLLYFTSISL